MRDRISEIISESGNESDIKILDNQKYMTEQKNPRRTNRIQCQPKC